MSYGDVNTEVNSSMLLVTSLDMNTLSTCILEERNCPARLGEVFNSQLVESIDWCDEELVQQELGRFDTLRVCPSGAVLLSSSLDGPFARNLELSQSKGLVKGVLMFTALLMLSMMIENRTRVQIAHSLGRLSYDSTWNDTIWHVWYRILQPKWI